MPIILQLGRVVATRGTVAKFTRAQLLPLLDRHMRGDWGEVDPDDWRTNDAAAKGDDRVLSIYNVAGETLWIITEADRSVTTILFPSEY
jgi:hypothetical protein